MKTYLWTCIYVSGPYLIYLDLCYCNLNATYLEFNWTCTLLECYCDREIVSKFCPNSIESRPGWVIFPEQALRGKTMK